MLGAPERRRKTGSNVRRFILLAVLLTCATSFFVITSLRLEPMDLSAEQVNRASNPIREVEENPVPKQDIEQQNVELTKEPKEQKEQECYFIDGYSSCGFFRKAKCVSELLNESEYNAKAIITGGERSDYLERLPRLKQGVSGSGVAAHKTSPFVRSGCGSQKKFIGGANEFVSYSRKAFPNLNFRACV